MAEHYLKKLAKIKLLAFDMDGVFTDGTMMMFPGEEPVRSFHARDGFALRQAIEAGLQIAIITRGKSEEVKRRMLALGVQDVVLGAFDKWDALETLLFSYDITADEVLYMGDDVPDLEVLERVGIPCCPSDAIFEVQKACTYISDLPGGKGCVRDVIEKVMRAKDLWK
jgi:3-deoxy-D-manno-octulosonate 8-phosphate phosphatase (KDO 8-P phosphatase)